jgi:hypothetical protein
MEGWSFSMVDRLPAREDPSISAGGPVVDKAALEQFEKQSTTYQKVVDADWLSHK